MTGVVFRGGKKIDGTDQHTWNVAAAKTSTGTKGIRMEPASRRPQRKAFSHWLRSKCLLSSGRKIQLGLPTISATFCCILCIKNVDISSTFLKIYTGWSESELELHCRAWGHRTDASLAKHQRPLASGFSWQFANHKISRGHSLAVAFAVCSSRLNGRKGFQQQVTFGKVFCH